VVHRAAEFRTGTNKSIVARRSSSPFAQKLEIEPVLQPLIESLAGLELQIRRSAKLLAANAGAGCRDGDLRDCPEIRREVSVSRR
jgi:hypothetical protein